MTQSQVWNYMMHRIGGPVDAHRYALKQFATMHGFAMFQITNPQDAAARGLLEEFERFEVELSRLGEEMVHKPRNQRFPAKLPNNYNLVAIAFGTDHNDFLAIVLGAHATEPKFATWVANYDLGPQEDDAVVCGNGEYFDARDHANLPNDGNQHKRALESAWNNFFVRASGTVRPWGLRETP